MLRRSRHFLKCFDQKIFLSISQPIKCISQWLSKYFLLNICKRIHRLESVCGTSHSIQMMVLANLSVPALKTFLQSVFVNIKKLLQIVFHLATVTSILPS